VSDSKFGLWERVLGKPLDQVLSEGNASPCVQLEAGAADGLDRVSALIEIEPFEEPAWLMGVVGQSRSSLRV
jgi:hypothetical protein